MIVQSWRVLLLVVAISTAAQAEEVALRWKFTPGESTRFSLSQQTQLDLQLQAGSEVEASVDREFKFRWSVDKTEDDGSGWVSIDMEAIRLTVTGPGGQETEFDSESKEEPRGYAATLAPLFRIMLKSELKAQLTPEGDILDLQIPEDLELVLSTKPVGKALGTLGTKEDLIAIVTLAMPKFGEESLKVGEHWTAEQARDAEPFGAAVSETQYKLVSVDDQNDQQLITIVPSSKIELIESDDGKPKTKIVAQQSTGQLVFNITQGRPTSYDFEEELEIETSGADQPATGTIKHSLRLSQLEEEEDKLAEPEVN